MSVEFVQKAVDTQNDRFSWLEHAIKNLIFGLHQARPTSRRKRACVLTEIQDGDTSLTQAVSTCLEDTGYSCPEVLDLNQKVPCEVNLSPLPSDDPMFDHQSPA